MPVSQVVPREAYALQGGSPSTVYLDVRTEEEFAVGHPEGAYNVPLIQVDPAGGPPVFNTDFVETVEGLFPSETRILCGCESEGRSRRAAEMLVSAGFSDVFNVQGGFGGARHPMTGEVVIAGWEAEGLPVSREVGGDRSYRELRRRAGIEDEDSSG